MKNNLLINSYITVGIIGLLLLGLPANSFQTSSSLPCINKINNNSPIIQAQALVYAKAVAYLRDGRLVAICCVYSYDEALELAEDMFGSQVRSVNYFGKIVTVNASIRIFPNNSGCENTCR